MKVGRLIITECLSSLGTDDDDAVEVENDDFRTIFDGTKAAPGGVLIPPNSKEAMIMFLYWCDNIVFLLRGVTVLAYYE